MRDPALLPPRDSRVLVLSQRSLHRPLFHALHYEFEDLLIEWDDTSLVAPLPDARPPLARHVGNGVRRRAGLARNSPPGNRPAARPTTVDTRHDLFFAVFHDAYQLSYLNRLKGWRESSRRAVCLLMEVWTPGLAQDADYWGLLKQFDAVYCFTPQAGPGLESLGAPRTQFLPAGVDALRMWPGVPPPTRLIDVYTYGRTSPDVHQQLLRLAETRDLTYAYDTTTHGQVTTHREHRRLLGHLMRRSRFFLAHRINDSPERLARTGGEESLSTRYFEASAAGAVLLGSEPRTPAFRECFPWPDAVIPLPYDGGDVQALLDELAEQPERLALARAAGVRAGLAQHDWSHRWARVLQDAGLTATDALVTRQEQVRSAAALVDA